jgi:hypothetical protein
VEDFAVSSRACNRRRLGEVEVDILAAIRVDRKVTSARESDY